jgi:hypothetical protein
MTFKGECFFRQQLIPRHKIKKINAEREHGFSTMGIIVS